MHNTWTVPHVPTRACPVLHIQYMYDEHTITCTLLHVQYSTPCTCSKAWLGRSHGKCLSESRLVFCTWNRPEFWFFKAKGGYNELEDFDYLKPWVVVSGKSNVGRIIKLPVTENFEWFKCTTTVKNATRCRIQKSLSYTGLSNHKNFSFQSSHNRKKSFPCTLPAAISPHLRGSVQSRTPHPAFWEKKSTESFEAVWYQICLCIWNFSSEELPPAFLPIVKNQPCWTLKSTSIHSWLLKKMMMMWLSWSFRKNSSAWS